jgi:hypothetical protein
VASIGLRLAWIALIVIVFGCAGPRGGRVPSSADLAGSWRGAFWHVNAGDTGYIHGDLALELKEDGSYTGTWTTRVVAGSSRGGSMPVERQGTRHDGGWRRGGSMIAIARASGRDK